MVLPLLGLLGLGAAAYAEPYAAGRRERMLTKNRANIREGILADNPNLDMSDPQAVGSALFRGGILDPNDFQRDLRGAFEAEQDRIAAMERQRVSSAAGMMNAALNQRKYNDQVSRQKQEMQARVDLGMNPAHAAIPSLVQQFDQQYGQNAEAIRYAGMTDEERAALAYSQTIEQQAIDARNRVQINTERAQTDAINNAGQADILDRQIAYTEQVQPLVNQSDAVDWALQNIDDASFDSMMFSDTEGLQLSQAINQTLQAQRMDYWTNTLGREDAPSESEIEMLETMFPMITPGLRDQKRKDLIKNNLRTAQVSVQNQIEAAQRSLSMRGVQTPDVQSQFQVPSGWTKQ